jgi:3-isopropylmalate/(R)-2-methylmalate dehydratase small subunit
VLAVTLRSSQVRHLMDLAAEDPQAVAVVDLERQVVRGDGFEYRFEIDAYAREMLLKGLDDISLIENHDSEIGAYEKARPEWLPSVR